MSTTSRFTFRTGKAPAARSISSAKLLTILAVYTLLIAAGPTYAESISGTVYDSSGSQISEGGGVYAFTGDPCGDREYYGGSDILSDGAYLIEGIPPGQYYLIALADGNFISEWWTGSGSNRDCTEAQTVTVTAGQDVINTHFQLDIGATISGTVYDSVDNPLTSGYVAAFTGDPCTGDEHINSGNINADGTFTIDRLPEGDIYLFSRAQTNHVDEWWAEPSGDNDCSLAQAVTVTVGEIISDKDFHLDSGAQITGTVYDTSGNPITDGFVYAALGDPCGVYGFYEYAIINADGTYSVGGLVPGNYYLVTEFLGALDDEWWAESASSEECGQAEAVPVTALQTVTGKDFQIDAGARVSGTVYDASGNPITDDQIFISVVTGDPCGTFTPEQQSFISATDGTYTVRGLEGGNYYLAAVSTLDYSTEWWAESASTADCSQAQMMTLSSGAFITGKDFQLNPILFPYSVTTSTTPAAGGTITGGGNYADGTTATLTAVPAEGYFFVSWSGDVGGATNPLSITIDSDKNITANFSIIDEEKKKDILFPIRAKNGKVIILSM